MVATASSTENCISCGLEKHQFYAWSKFRSLSHAEKTDLHRSNNYCLNCLSPGHLVKKCRSLNHCKHCERPHHTLLHVERDNLLRTQSSTGSTPSESTNLYESVVSNILLMTCQVMVETPQRIVKARALLDTGSLASFVNERLVQSFHLNRYSQSAKICGIAGISHSDGKQAVTQFLVSSHTLRVWDSILILSLSPESLAISQSMPSVMINAGSITLADPEYDNLT